MAKQIDANDMEMFAKVVNAFKYSQQPRVASMASITLAYAFEKWVAQFGLSFDGEAAAQLVVNKFNEEEAEQ